MRRLAWPFGGLGLVALALLIVVAPKRYEGPILLSVTSTHAVTGQDAIASVPFLAGLIWLGSGLWSRREDLRSRIRQSPGTAVILVSVLSLGLGLAVGFTLGVLLGSPLSSIFDWLGLARLAVGVLLLGTLAAALVSALRR